MIVSCGWPRADGRPFSLLDSELTGDGQGPARALTEIAK